MLGRRCGQRGFMCFALCGEPKSPFQTESVLPAKGSLIVQAGQTSDFAVHPHWLP